MEKEGASNKRASEADFLIQWGNRKRHRCVKVKKKDFLQNSDGQIRTRGDTGLTREEKNSPSPHPNHLSRNPESATADKNRKSHSSSPEKEERYYTTRGSVFENGGRKLFTEGFGEEKEFVWPKFFVSLSSKEKEEDFMAMKGCKLPQRPKKRAKFIQKSLLVILLRPKIPNDKLYLVSPGAWLSDLSYERYEIREKKSSKKRSRGLKAMGSMESDSD